MGMPITGMGLTTAKQLPCR